MWLSAEIGENTWLRDVTSDEIAQLVAKPSGERRWNRSDLDFVTPATVNRTMTMRLREIVTRAHDV